VAVSGTGHALVMDDADRHAGAKPTELRLPAWRLHSFCGHRHSMQETPEVTRYEVELRAERNPNIPCFTRVKFMHRLRGDIEAVERVLHLSGD